MAGYAYDPFKQVKETYPQLSRLTTRFMEQDWAFDVADNEGLLGIEIIGRMFREHIDKWLADPEGSALVQEEIQTVLASTKTPLECEVALGIENHLYDFWGVNIRMLLKNLRTLLATEGHIVY